MMTVQPGDVYWLSMQGHIDHPHVVIAVNTDDGTLTLCALTTNPRKISVPGNVLLAAGEANLPKASVIEVSNQVTVAVENLRNAIGTLSLQRLAQIQAGIRLIERSFRDG